MYVHIHVYMSLRLKYWKINQVIRKWQIDFWTKLAKKKGGGGGGGGGGVGNFI